MEESQQKYQMEGELLPFKVVHPVVLQRDLPS